MAFESPSITYFARTNARNSNTLFGIKHPDRFSHMYIIGKTGTGKSTLLETLIRQDIEKGNGLALLDPHGDLSEKIAKSIPDHRAQDLLYFNTPDNSQPFGYNPLKRVAQDKRPLAASGLLEVFKKMWSDAWGPRMEHILRNALFALMDQEVATLPDVLRLLRDDQFRKNVSSRIRNQQVKDFWLSEYAKYPPRTRSEAILPIQNKVGAFLANPLMYRILTEPEKSISLRKIMDERKILLINLAKGQIGEDSAGLLGGLLITTIALAAFSRAELPEEKRHAFYVYVDEFQNFTTLSVANMIAELRKYRIGLILANQYLHQLEPDIRHAVLGNAGTLISFRLGAQDVSFISKEFQPDFNELDLITLPNHHIYLKLMIDGAPSKPFSAVTLSAEEITIGLN